jgi:DNA-binding LacI/PurR family transcriptional regulator
MITLSKIAKEAHVSVSTASKAFSGSTEVNEETRELIFDVAKRYGCFKKFFNAKYSKYVIAIICPEFSSIHYTSYLAHLHRYLEQAGCEICVAESNFSAAKEKELLDYYCKHADVDAVIMIHPKIDYYDFHEIPVLSLGRMSVGKDCASILCRHVDALTKSIDYLIENGVNSVGFIGESRTLGKLSNFREVLSEKGLSWNPDHIQIVQKRFEAGGYEAMERMLHTDTLPRAVICAYDNMAIGAMRCISDHGLRVPEDIAIMGMDDIPQAPYTFPSLASITTQTEERCQLAVESIVSLINGQEVPSVQVVEAQFKFRESFRIGSAV